MNDTAYSNVIFLHSHMVSHPRGVCPGQRGITALVFSQGIGAFRRCALRIVRTERVHAHPCSSCPISCRRSGDSPHVQQGRALFELNGSVHIFLQGMGYQCNLVTTWGEAMMGNATSTTSCYEGFLISRRLTELETVIGRPSPRRRQTPYLGKG